MSENTAPEGIPQAEWDALLAALVNPYAGLFPDGKVYFSHTPQDEWGESDG